MMNKIMAGMIGISALFALALGKGGELTSAVLESGARGVEFCLELCGIICIWCGVMKIAEKSGLCERVSRLLSPITSALFPGLARSSAEAMDSISMNITANILGLGSAATPFALRAMGKLDELNGGSHTASDHMVVFTVLNTASFQLVPTTVAAIRASAGSKNPLDIIFCVWLSSAVSVLVAVIGAKTLCRARRKKEEGRRCFRRSADG